jgi:peptidyl-prolyl cis-trans isomerase D
MATLERIRKRGVLLLIIVGLAMFAFIIGDFLNSSQTYFGQMKQKVAVINGETIKYPDFLAAVEQLTTVYKLEGQQPNEDMSEQIRQQVWENKMSEILLSTETEKLGLTVSKDELTDLTIGKNISPLITGRRVFADPQTGQFSRDRLLGLLQELQKNANTNTNSKQQNDELKELQQYWLFFESMVKQSTLQQKYAALLSKAVNANSLDAKFAFERSQRSVDMLYVMQPYFTIPDASVKVTDNDVKSLYNKHKERYKQEANSDIKFVTFEVKPSKEDFGEVEKKINDLKNEFTTTADLKTFINNNSDQKYIDVPLTKNEVPQFLQDFAFGGNTGDIVGPKLENDIYYMAKIIEGHIQAPDSVKLRHILVGVPDKKGNLDEAATATLADSITKAIKGGADFAVLARKYSRIQQTAANGGEIGWARVALLNSMGIDKDMADKLSKAGINEVVSGKQQGAVQLMEITQKTAPVSKVKLGLLSLRVIPSDKTTGDIYNTAKRFAVASTSIEKFEKEAKTNGYTVQPATNLDPNTPRLAGIKNSRKVIQWANDHKTGDISDVEECGEPSQVYIVAAITASRQKGYKDIKEVTPELKAEIINDKKAEILIKNMSTTLASAKTIEGLASSLKLKVDSATNLNFFSSRAGSLDFEPAVIGAASEGKLHQVSAPVKGKKGVYVYNVVNVQQKSEPFNAKSQKDMLNSRYAYMLPYLSVQILKDKADIKDNRAKFF